MSIHTLTPALLSPMLASSDAPLVLDVRRRKGFEELPKGLPHAVPVYLDDDPILLPDTDRSVPIVAYCL